MLKHPALAAPELGSCASSARARRLWLAPTARGGGMPRHWAACHCLGCWRSPPPKSLIPPPLAIQVGDKGELFANEVRAARANGFQMVMVHENDEADGGCEFARFFETTPQDLIADGLYKALAYAWYPDPFRQVSLALV